jgi:hypothetical protein
LTITTAQGKFPFRVEQKASYLDRTLLHALISLARNDEQHPRRPLLLLARYIPEPSAELLIENGVNFVDRAGNMHLVLGHNYSRTVIGRKEAPITKEATAITRAGVQLLFTFAAYEEAGGWPVRELAKASGVGKSNVAKLRRQLVEKSFLQESRGTFKIRDKKVLEHELLRGYGEALRPRLFINRFRAAESSAEKLTDRIALSLGETPARWSLTGGPAAYELQHFYRGAEVPLFIDKVADTTIRHLRLLPDAEGPIILLRPFGTLPYWQEKAGKMLAHPWLIYAELMYSTDPRAHEAAKELERQFLK